MMSKDRIRVGFPKRYLKRKLVGTVEDAINAIREANGREVLVSDCHSSSFEDEYVFGKVRFDSEDKECYYLQVPLKFDGSPPSFREERFHYNDLQGLLVGGEMKSHSVEFVSK